MKIINFLLALVFLVFAFVQVNDPDGAYWILIYGAVSVLCVLAMFRYYPLKVIWGLIFLYVIYMGFLFPGVLNWLAEDDKSVFFDQMQVEKPYIEESREFFGIFLAVMALAFHLFSRRYFQKQTAS